MKNTRLQTLALGLIGGLFLTTTVSAQSGGGLGTGSDECENRGVETVPTKLGMYGPMIDCDGSWNISVDCQGVGADLAWQGVSCPTFIQLIPSHDKAVIKPGFSLDGPPISVPRKELRFICVEGGWFSGDNCVPNGETDALPPVKHYYEIPCRVRILGPGF
jgi:hypothetical protein